MSIDIQKRLESLAPSDRAVALLSAADAANRTIMATHPETFDVCKQAIQRCRDWLSHKPVNPEDLAAYIDADEAANPWMQESVFRTDPEGLNALVFMVMVVGFVAHLAYLRAGTPERMSEAIAEADENILESIADYGKAYGLLEVI